MRALIDANIFISYLLIPFGDRDPNIIVDAATENRYVPLLAPELVDEISRKIRGKQYLADRISLDAVRQLIELLRVFAEELPALDAPFPALGRDRKDDYLFAQAVLGGADFIVSGDKDVITQGTIGSIRIMSTAAFAQMLKQMKLEDE